MRTPKNFIPTPPKPPKFLSISFVGCERCMRHGYFFTDPPLDAHPTVFSKAKAFQYVGEWFREDSISQNQFYQLLSQVANSPLPNEVPPEVRVLINEYASWEVELERCATAGESESVTFLWADVADTVHQAFVDSPDHPELRTQ